MRWILLMVGLMLMVWTASATDYYIDTNTGNDIDDGQSLADAWLTLAHADGQLSAGDTLYFVDGTWSNEHFVLTTSGTSSNPITLTAYNGTPTLDGVDETGYGISISSRSYVTIKDLHLNNYSSAIYGAASHNCIITNCTINRTDSRGMLFTQSTFFTINNNEVINCGNGGIYLSGYNSNSFTIENNSCHGNTSNVLLNLGPNHCIVRNNTIYDGSPHGAIDIHSDCWHNIIENNTIYDIYVPAVGGSNGIYVHNYGWYNNTVRHNTIHDVAGDGIALADGYDAKIYNNTVYNVSGAGLEVMVVVNSSIYDNNITGEGMDLWLLYAVVIEVEKVDNVTFTDNLFPNGTITLYATNGTNTFQNTTTNNNNQFTFSVSGSPNTYVVEYFDGRIFTTTLSTKPLYYTDKSNVTHTSTATITYYNDTLLPSVNYLQNVTVNHDSVPSDDRTNISINSSVAENPTWINVTMQNASHVYNISRDGVYYNQVSSGTDKVVRYHYTIAGDEWSSHDFEFTWHSSGVCAAEGNTDITQIGDIIYVYGADKYCNMEYLYQQVANSTALSKSGSTYFANASIYVNGTSTTLNINGVCCDWLKLNSTGSDIAYLRFDGYGEIDDSKITSWNTTISNYDNRTNESQPRAYIYYANGKGNITDSTFSHLGFTTAYHYGIHVVSATSGFSATGNTIEYNYDGITLINSNGATVSDNFFNNSGWHGTYLQGSDNCVVYNNEYNNNDYGIFVHASSDNNDVTYNSLNGDGYGLTLWSSEYNDVSHNIINGTTNGGLRFYETNNNTADNNTVTYCDYGLTFQNKCYNNTVRNGSFHNSMTYDYYVWYTNNDSSNDNHIVTTNFTSSQKINFGGDVNTSSRFNYTNVSSEDLWVATNVTSSSYFTTTRSLISFNQDDVSWSETWSASISPCYELTGLTANHEYTIYNGTESSTQTTDALGNLNFTIDFLTFERTIQVLYFDTNYSLSYYNLSNPILITSKVDGTNVFNRTITSQDTELSDFKMVVSTT